MENDEKIGVFEGLELDLTGIQALGRGALGLEALDLALPIHQLEHVVARHLSHMK